MRAGRLLAVDWVPPQDDGQREVRLQDGELTGWTLAAPRERDVLLAPHMARRVRACASAQATGTAAYLQYGRPLAGVL